MKKKGHGTRNHSRKRSANRVKLHRENLILLKDEPAAFWKTPNRQPPESFFDIVANYPVKLTILASATMAEAKELAKTKPLPRWLKLRNWRRRPSCSQKKLWPAGY
jgi:hypothetical protein